MVELEPCPFCGTLLTLISYEKKRRGLFGYKEYEAYVRCHHCGAQGPTAESYRVLYATNTAGCKWNRRIESMEENPHVSELVNRVLELEREVKRLDDLLTKTRGALRASEQANQTTRSGRLEAKDREIVGLKTTINDAADDIASIVWRLKQEGRL